MPEFRKNIGGPNLGSISGVRAVRPADTGASTAKAVGTLAQVGIQAYGRSAARSAGKEIGGQEETAVSVDKGLTQATNELEMDVLLGGDQGQDLSPAQLEDIKKSKFDEVLGTQKRLQSALKRGLISSTEANARINMLRNEALSNPFVAMFQKELDTQLYPSGTGGKQGGLFGPTEAEKIAAGQAKGRAEAAEKQAKEISLIQASTGFNEKASTALWQKGEFEKREAENLEAKSKSFNYNAKEYAAYARFGVNTFSDQGMVAINEFVKGGGSAESVAPTVAKLTALKAEGRRVLSEKMYNTEGQVVGKGADFDKSSSQLDSIIDGYIELVKGDFSQAEILNKSFTETSNAQKVQDQESMQAMFGAYPSLGAIMRSGNQSLVDFALSVVQNQDTLKTKVEASGNPILKSLMINLTGRELGAEVGKSVDKVSTGKTADMPEEEKQKTRAVFAATSVLDSGPMFAASAYGQGNDESIDRDYQKAPIAIDQIANSRAWMSSMRTDPNALRAVSNMIQGAARRSRVAQFATVTDGPIIKGGFGVFQTEENTGLPTSVTVKKVPRTPGYIGTSYIIDSVSNAKLSDEYKKNITQAYKMGVANEGLWKDEFENVDQWINALFAGGDAQPKEESAEEPKKEGISLISSAHGSELDPSEVDAGFPEELSSFAQAEDKQLRSDEGTEKNSKGENISYRDNAKEKNLTGGVGHLLTSDEKALYPEGTVIPQAVVDKWFAEDIKVAESDVEALIPNAPEEVKSIVINMAFQLGRTKLSKFKKTLLLLEEGDFKEASKEMLDSDWAKQTPNRARRLSKRMRALATSPNPESPKSLLEDLDTIDKQRANLKLFSANRNLTFQEMVDEGIINEQEFV